MKIMLDEGAIMPTRAHETDAGLDLYARETKTINPMNEGPIPLGFGFMTVGGRRGSATFDTGVHVELPPGWFGKVESKSGLNVNHGIVCCGGVIDEGYTGSIVVKLYNLSDNPYTVNAGDKIAQLVITQYATPEIELVEQFDDTDRGTDGFGSTGR